MDCYAVIGHPVGHSRSPWIHARFARQAGVSLRYSKLDVAPEAFAAALDAFFAGGGHGLNVTVPHKAAAFSRADVLGAEARLGGDNTDGRGLVADLAVNHEVALAGARVLLIGAGGAARGALGALLAAGPASVQVANRTLARAREVVAAHGGVAAGASELHAVGLDALAPEAPFDLVINATAAGLAGEVPAVPPTCVGPQTAAYDMVYGPGATAFTAWAHDQGAARALQGTGMLVEQAAESFLRWRGVRPETGAVRQCLEAMLAGKR